MQQLPLMYRSRLSETLPVVIDELHVRSRLLFLFLLSRY